MKPFVRSIMFTGVLAMAASSVAVAQTSSNSFEQWYRAKYGRHDTVSARNYTEPVQPPTYGKAQVRQMMRDAHTREQYLVLAEYYRGQQQTFREHARREWSEAVRLSQFSSATAGRYPRPVDWSMIRYEYFSHKSRQMAQKSAYWEKLSASASQ